MKRNPLFLLLFLVLFIENSRAQRPSISRTAPQLVLQIAHVGEVTALAVSPDEKMFASASTDNTAKVWDARTGALLFSFPHAAVVKAISLPNSTTLVCAGADGSVRHWDTVSGALRTAQSGGEVKCTAAALSPDGTLAAFALDNGKIVVRQSLTGTTVATLEGHPTSILALAFSSDGKMLASTSDAFREKPVDEALARRAGDVRVWDVEAAELVRTLRGHALSVRGVAWSSDGSRLASVGESGTAVLWDAQTFARLNEFNVSEGKGRALAVAFAPDGKSLVVGWRGGVQAWDIANAKSRWALAKEESVSQTHFLSNGSVVMSGRDGTLQLLDTVTGEPTAITGRIAPVSRTRVSPDGKFIVSANSDGAVCLWDARTGQLIRSWRGHLGSASDAAFSPDNAELVTAGTDGAVRLWNVPTGKLVRSWSEFSGAVSAVAFSRDGKTLAVGSSGGKYDGVSLWDATNGAFKQTLSDLSGQIHSLAFNADNSLVGVARQGQIVAWDAAFDVRARDFLRGARAIAFSADGKRRAIAGALLDENEDFAAAGDVVQIWNARAGALANELTTQAPGARALDVAWSADNKTLATASADGTIRLLDTNGLLKTLHGHIGPVQSVAFGPSGAQIVSAGRDGTIRVWNAATGRLSTTLIALGTVEKGATVGETLALDWLALTPDGYFDGSPGASRAVQWRLGADVFPVEAFERAFRSPTALEAAMRGEAVTEPKANAFAAGAQIPPSVSITMPKAGEAAGTGVVVSGSASDDKDLRSVQLWINGRPAGSRQIGSGAKPLETGAKALELGAKALELGAKPLEIGAKPLETGAKPVPSNHQLNWTFTLPAVVPANDSAGVTVKAIVTDGDGLQGNDEIRLTRTGASASGTLHVLSVGVSAYQNAALNLKYAGADATAFAALWSQTRGKLFNKVNVVTLVDNRATATAVKTAMQDIARAAGPDDVVAIFLSGHGAQRNPGEFFFATTDVALDNLAATTVPWTAFQEALAASRARRIVLFLDACHSGGALGGRQAGNENMAEQLVQNAGAVVFASSLGSQQSFELDTVKHGAFTQAIVEGIGEGKADLDAGAGRDGVVNVEELLTFLRARIPQLTEGAQMPACPLLRDFGEPFPLAKIKE